MSKIDNSIFNSPNNFTVHEYSVEYDEDDGEQSVPTEVTIPISGGATRTIVIVERGHADVSVTADDGEEPEINAPSDFQGGGRLFLTFRNIRKLTLRFAGWAGEKIRAMVIVLLRELEEYPSELSCFACKECVHFLLTALLAAIGHGFPLLVHGRGARAVQDLLNVIHGPIGEWPAPFRILFEELSGQFREILGNVLDAIHGSIEGIRATVGDQAWQFAMACLNPIGFIANEVCHRFECCPAED